MISANTPVVMHRPPLRHIGGPRFRPADPPTIDIYGAARLAEQDRIWKLVRQSAEGCNAVGDET